MPPAKHRVPHARSREPPGRDECPGIRPVPSNGFRDPSSGRGATAANARDGVLREGGFVLRKSG
ncbi:hypothetical protein GCM10010431_29690 [Streptomyces kunmingensis]